MNTSEPFPWLGSMSDDPWNFSNHKWIDTLVSGKTIKICELCHVMERDIACYLDSDYCTMTPQAIEWKERYEYFDLTRARDIGRQEGTLAAEYARRSFESSRSRWEQLDSKYGQK